MSANNFLKIYYTILIFLIYFDSNLFWIKKESFKLVMNSAFSFSLIFILNYNLIVYYNAILFFLILNLKNLIVNIKKNCKLFKS